MGESMLLYSIKLRKMKSNKFVLSFEVLLGLVSIASQDVAECHRVLQHFSAAVSIGCNVLQSIILATSMTLCDTLRHFATLCDILQYSATLCDTLRHSATLCDTLRHSATLCETLRHSATLCNTLRHNSLLWFTLHL